MRFPAQSVRPLGDRGGQLEIHVAGKRPGQCHSLGEECVPLWSMPEVDIRGRHGGQKVRADRRLSCQGGVQVAAASLQQVARGELVAHRMLRIGGLEQLYQEFTHGPLLRRLRRRQPSAVGRHPRLPGRPRQPRCQRQPNRQRRSDTKPVAPHELGRPVAPGVRPRRDRQSSQITPDIARELLHGGIAPIGLLPERRKNDRVEVAA